MRFPPPLILLLVAWSVSAAPPDTDPSQTSRTLDPAVIADGFASDGQNVTTDPGQVASLTSTNNFINFCKTVNLPLTNGKQILGGSCNPAPMGVLPAKEKMPSSKFVFPKNGATIGVNQTFTIQMRIKDLETGNFVNAAQNFYAAPQQLNGQGIIRGHSHVVIQQIPALDSTDLLNPEAFVFFKGLNSAGNSAGILAVEVTNGLPAGVYKISSINTASNHQPALAPVAQRGSLDDTVYFTVSSSVRSSGARSNPRSSLCTVIILLLVLGLCYKQS